MDFLIQAKRRQGMRLACLLAAAFCCAAAYGKEIYRWIDDSGQTHFSDKAPRHVGKPVTTIDTGRDESSLAQRKQAEARAAREKARAAALAEPAESASPDSPREGDAAVMRSPAGSDCASLLQRFRESAACYAPFLNVNGSMKPHALETCGPPVPYPAKECS